MSEVAEAGFTNKQLRLGGFDAIDMKDVMKLSVKQCKEAGYTAYELRVVGFLASELKEAGFAAEDLATCCKPGEIYRTGFSKDVLKPLGFWKHDGEWQYYNGYWSCCHSLDGESIFCQALKSRNTLGSDLAC